MMLFFSLPKVDCMKESVPRIKLGYKGKMCPYVTFKLYLTFSLFLKAFNLLCVDNFFLELSVKSLVFC